MFCQLFGVESAPPPATKKQTKVKKSSGEAKPKTTKETKPKTTKETKPRTNTNPKKKKKDPEPQVIEGGAPFEHIKEESPDPCEMDTLMYEELEDSLEQHDDDWESVQEEETSLNYDATSITEDDENMSCSVDSSPGMFFERRMKSVLVEKKRPPGIAVTFDDDSWIN